MRKIALVKTEINERKDEIAKSSTDKEDEEREKLQRKLAELECHMAELEKQKDETAQRLRGEIPFETRYSIYCDLTEADAVWMDAEHCRAAAIGLKAKVFLFVYAATADGKLLTKAKEQEEIVEYLHCS